MSTFVLVHGAWCDGSVWREVTPLLSAPGRRVAAIDGLPSGGAERGDLAADAAHLRAVVDGLPESEEVILVGHSYGGMVISELADHPRVRHSAYLAAFLPEAGESIMDLRSEHAVEWVFPTVDGAALRVTGDPEVARQVMAADLPADRFAEFFAGLGQQSIASFTSPSRAPARTHPVTYLLCERDRSILPADQERMAAAADRVHRLDAGHMMMLSRPREVAELLLDV